MLLRQSSHRKDVRVETLLPLISTPSHSHFPLVYLAGAFSNRYRLREIREELIRRGYAVLSSWLDREDETWPATKPSREEARRDLLEMQQMDIFIVDTLIASTMGNNFCEFGFALSHPCQKYRVGPARNHYHLLIPGFQTWKELLDAFSR